MEEMVFSSLLDFHQLSGLVRVIKSNVKTLGNVLRRYTSGLNVSLLHLTDFHTCFSLDFNPHTHLKQLLKPVFLL